MDTLSFTTAVLPASEYYYKQLILLYKPSTTCYLSLPLE